MFHDGHLGLLTSAAELAPIVEDFLYEGRADRRSAHPVPEQTAAAAEA
jgi:hypothetical protein